MWDEGGKCYLLYLRVNYGACEWDISEYLMVPKIDWFLIRQMPQDVMEGKKSFQLERGFVSKAQREMCNIPNQTRDHHLCVVLLSVCCQSPVLTLTVGAPAERNHRQIWHKRVALNESGLKQKCRRLVTASEIHQVPAKSLKWKLKKQKNKKHFNMLHYTT